MAFKLYDSNNHVIGNMIDVVTSSEGEMWITLDTGHKFQFQSSDIRWDGTRNAYIKKYGVYHQDMIDNARYAAQAKVMYSRAHQKEARAGMNTAGIKDVIFAPPATVVYWTDGTKTVVKCSENDIFDPEKGLAMAIAKRAAGNKGNYYKEIRKWVENSGKKYPPKRTAPAKQSADQNVLKKYISEANKDLTEFMNTATSGDDTMAVLKLTALAADLKILEIEINK